MSMCYQPRRDISLLMHRVLMRTRTSLMRLPIVSGCRADFASLEPTRRGVTIEERPSRQFRLILWTRGREDPARCACKGAPHRHASMVGMKLSKLEEHFIGSSESSEKKAERASAHPPNGACRHRIDMAIFVASEQFPA